MKAANILLASIVGTTAMSIFSYATSKKKNKNFKEPELLGKLIHRVVPLIDTKEAQATGWSMHYIAGVAFAEVYAQVLKYTNVKPTIKNGLLIGGLSGIPAIAIWYAVFKMHPNPPKKHFKNYFGHLLLAHVVFGASTFAAYSAEKKLRAAI